MPQQSPQTTVNWLLLLLMILEASMSVKGNYKEMYESACKDKTCL